MLVNPYDIDELTDELCGRAPARTATAPANDRRSAQVAKNDVYHLGWSIFEDLERIGLWEVAS
ncbi:MAG: hypothetical protein ACLQBD_22215 [Syntrophobacteraceae bacterium]